MERVMKVCKNSIVRDLELIDLLKLDTFSFHHVDCQVSSVRCNVDCLLIVRSLFCQISWAERAVIRSCSQGTNENLYSLADVSLFV
uniref:Uncharacterized protein n=1 Tax=Arundo donax TaxID=35708 RepID=A0A0A9EXL6_ARUDO